MHGELDPVQEVGCNVNAQQLFCLCPSLRFHGADCVVFSAFRSLTKRCCDRSLINFGIHDTWVHEHVPPKQYGDNLERIFTMGKAGLAPGGKLIWSSTTPISSNCTGCGDGTTTDHVVEYNAIALEAFNKVVGTTDGVVNDLHAEVNEVCGVNFKVCPLQDYNNEHPSIPGAAFLGIKTAQTIAPFLNPRRGFRGFRGLKC